MRSKLTGKLPGKIAVLFNKAFRREEHMYKYCTSMLGGLRRGTVGSSEGDSTSLAEAVAGHCTSRLRQLGLCLIMLHGSLHSH